MVDTIPELILPERGKRRKPPQPFKRTTKNSVTSPRLLTLAERNAQVLEWRKQGLNYVEIGRLAGISHAMAFKIVDTAIKNLQREPAEQLVTLELARLDKLWAAIYPRAVSKKNTFDIETLLHIHDRRCRLLGLGRNDDQARADIRIIIEGGLPELNGPVIEGEAKEVVTVENPL